MPGELEGVKGGRVGGSSPMAFGRAHEELFEGWVEAGGVPADLRTIDSFVSLSFGLWEEHKKLKEEFLKLVRDLNASFDLCDRCSQELVEGIGGKS